MEPEPTATSAPESRDDDTARRGDATAPRLALRRSPGDMLGAYRLERPLGHGGFGEVWLAVHDGLHRKAALKLLRPDRLGERSLRRFEVERESLRLLAHPNVAKIYDAGTAPDATPYIAMEFIEGVPITQYCERMRLTIEERLALMATVCDAMHYVHLQGIIHRDLSPDNILVALSGPDEGQPKIIDFGIARSATPFVRLSEGTIGEGLGHVVGKLLYMSPEQAEAGPGGVDARTDVYALGVILYEMLAGVLPLDDDRLRASPFSQAVRSILETNRPAPGTRIRELDPEKRRALAEARRESDGEAVAKRLEGRVRFLPLTAMHVDRSRRFASASAMAEDIRNWLAGRDYVQAAEDPWWDRSWRHVVRHRVLWGAIAAALLALVAGVVGTTMGLQEARRSAAIAEDRLALSESVIAYLTDDLLGADEQSAAPGDTTVEELLASAPARIDRRFADRPAVRARLLGALGAWAIQTGQREHADEVLAQARAAAEAAGADPATLAGIDLQRSEALWRLGRADEAQALAQAAVDAFTAARGADDPVTLAARNQLANAIKHAGRPQDAEPLYRQLLADRTRVLSATHLDTLITEHNLALAIFMQAKAATDPAVKAAKLAEAIELESGNWERTKRSLGAGHEQALAAGSEVAAMLQSADRLGDAERVYAEIVPVMRDRLGGGHWRTRTTGANYGRLLLKAGRLDRAVPELDAALASFKSRLGPVSGDTAVIAAWLAEAYERRGEGHRAEATLVELFESMIAAPPSAERDRLARQQAGRIAELLERTGDTTRAAPWRAKADGPSGG